MLLTFAMIPLVLLIRTTRKTPGAPELEAVAID